jgi:hypothetical protein
VAHIFITVDTFYYIMSNTKVLYQSPGFNATAPLVLFSQHLLQNDETKSKAVLNDLATKGYYLCVVADRNVIENKRNRTQYYCDLMKKTLVALGHPVKFAHLEQFDDMAFAIDTDQFDRIDYDGPIEIITSPDT